MTTPNLQATTNGQSQSSLQKRIFKILMSLFVATTAPVVVTLVFIPILTIIFDFGCEGSRCVGIDGSIVLGFWFFVFALPIAILHTGIFGLPAAVIGYKTKMIRWWTCTLIGFLIGYLPSFISIATTNIKSIPNMKDFQGPDWLLFPATLPLALIAPLLIGIFMGFFGAIGGFSFWATWRLLPPRIT